MTIYKKTMATSKGGVNFVRSAVENSGSLFHKIEQESDLGIDALIEFIRDEKPLNKQVAAQIKSGASYYNVSSQECRIPIENHRAYWSSHPLPVVGIVYIPALEQAHWINVKAYLKEHPSATVIRYKASEANRFDSSTFSTIVTPTLVGETPQLSLTKALELFHSDKPDEVYLGLVVLFRRYPNAPCVWDDFIRFFKEKMADEIPPIIIYFLAHAPWHGDIYHYGEELSSETRYHACELLSGFGTAEVAKLLGFIDTENGISRGSLGQSVEAIVSSIPHCRSLLEQIVVDESIDPFRRECASVILAFHEQSAALPALRQLAGSGSWYAQEIIDVLEEGGVFDLY